MSLEMDQTDIDQLLEQPHVGVLAISDSDGGAPLMTPLWFLHVDGVVVATTARASMKVSWLRRTPRATFFVQSEAPPRYVAITAVVDITEADEELRRRIAARYLPPEALGDYIEQTKSADVVALRIRPIRYRSADLTKVASPT